jgi:hypothetical protein
VDPADRLRERHERLCFVRAFPPSARALRRAERELAGFERRVRRHRDDLFNSGIAGTRYFYTWNHRMARWLSDRHGRAVEVDWEEFDKHEWDEVSALLSLVVAWAENEGLDDDDVQVKDWVKLARGRGRGSDLAWLLATIERMRFPYELRRHLFESLNLPLVWDLAGCRDSVTHAVFPVRRRFYHRELVREPSADVVGAIRRPTGPLQLLPRVRGQRIIDAGRAALSQRAREFHVIVHGNPDEVYRVDCGRGLELFVIGLVRRLRLTVESDFGALLVKNGVPIGYGYAVLLGDRADVGINVFPTYRGGESAYILEKFCAAFHHHFGARKFVMRRYQVGWHNPEGIEAGSYWFYHKLGFRSADAGVRALAARERERLDRRRGSRSGPAMLKRLSRSDMVLCTDDTDVADYRDIDPKATGLALTRLIATRYRGDRERALRHMGRRLARALGARGVAAVPGSLASGRPTPGSLASALLPPVLWRLVPVIGLIPDLQRWSPDERRALGGLLRAKEARRERGFVLALQRHPRFLRFLRRLSDAQRPLRP